MATQTQKRGSNGSGHDVEDVTKQIETIKSDIAELSSLLKDVASDRANGVKATAKHKADEAAAFAQLQAERVRGEAERLTNQTGDLVRANPGMAVGVAAAIGFAVGILSSSRR